MTMTVIVRGYLKRKVVFRHDLTINGEDLPGVVGREGEAHARAMAAGELDMVELEFPEFPPHHRYFRIGVNPDGMVMPIEIISRPE